ncbi:MAG: hypothetical protein ACLP6Z_02905 [Steroidobacteraceae bacterium]
MYSIPGAATPAPASPADSEAAAVQNASDAHTVNDILAQSQVGAVMDEIQQPHFANARGVRNALDRASRVFELAAAQNST